MTKSDEIMLKSEKKSWQKTKKEKSDLQDRWLTVNNGVKNKIVRVSVGQRAAKLQAFNVGDPPKKSAASAI